MFDVCAAAIIIITNIIFVRFYNIRQHNNVMYVSCVKLITFSVILIEKVVVQLRYNACGTKLVYIDEVISLPNN